jgi:hypothetical protein
MSKFFAERAAWDFAATGTGLDHQPALVLGPVQSAARRTSVELIQVLLAREVPAVPRLGFAVTDVRDVAVAHRLARETAGAAGNRYIVAGEHLWLREMAAILAAEYRPRGYRVPTGPLPTPLVWLAARFDPRLKLTLSMIGIPQLVSAEGPHRPAGRPPAREPSSRPPGTVARPRSGPFSVTAAAPSPSLVLAVLRVAAWVGKFPRRSPSGPR